MVQNILDRFKELRRPRRVRSEQLPHSPSTTPSRTPKRAKMKSEKVSARPIIPPGEDQISFSRHSSKLVEMFKKKPHLRNEDVIDGLMTLTYPLRRGQILDGKFKLVELLETYPFLQEFKQVHYITQYSSKFS